MNKITCKKCGSNNTINKVGYVYHINKCRSCGDEHITEITVYPVILLLILIFF